MTEAKIFITGGTGMLGAHFIQLILERTPWSIIALYRSSSDRSLAPESERIQWIEGDLDDLIFLKNKLATCNHVVHIAGMLSVRGGNLDKLLEVNEKGVAQMMDTCLEVGLPRLVYISSVAALGREGKALIDENDHFEEHPLVSDYARSKYAGDRQAYRGRAEGLDVQIIRPSLILGSGHWTSGSDGIVPQVERQFPFYPVGGTGVVDVRDVCELTLDVLLSDQKGVDCIVNGHNVTFKDLQSRIADALGVRAPSRPLQEKHIFWLGIWSRIKTGLIGQKSVVSTSSLKRAQQFYYYDNSQSQNIKNGPYRPVHQSVTDMVAAYQKYKKSQEKSLLSFSS